MGVSPTISKPTGVNVGVSNPGTIVYVKGNETTDGGIRFIIGSDQICRIEQRKDGVWNPTDLQLDSSSLRLGRGFRLGAASNHLIIETESGNRQLVSTSDIEDSGTRPPHAVILGPLLTRLVVQPDESLEQTLVDHLSSSFVLFDAFTEAVYFKVGSVGATADVVLRNSSGALPNDFLFREITFPASAFPANTEVRIGFEASTAFTVGEQVNTKLTSANPFSILYNAPGDRFWVAVDTRSSRKEDILSHPTGLDRFLMSNDGNHIASEAGNFIIREAA